MPIDKVHMLIRGLVASDPVSCNLSYKNPCRQDNKTGTEEPQRRRLGESGQDTDGAIGENHVPTSRQEQGAGGEQRTVLQRLA
jgi:hypothetical protein